MPSRLRFASARSSDAHLPREVVERLRAVLDRFGRAWRRGEQPDIDDYLAAADTERRTLLIELVHEDLDCSLQVSGNTRVESYLERYPELSADRTVVLELVAAEWDLRRRHEPGLGIEEYRNRFPDYEAQLCERLPVLGAGKPETVNDLGATSEYHPPPPTEGMVPVASAAFAGHPEPALAGDLPAIPGYEILGVLGRGGMGIVYKARQTSLKRLVALKMILAGGHAGPHELARFRAEAEAIARFQHPNIVQVYEIGQHGGLPYICLEYVEGSSLSKKLAGTPLPATSAARLAETLARAVHAAHERGVVHRDLKPGNILVVAGQEQADCLFPKITDFGLAKQLDEDSGQTATGAVMGTPSYMAPEQALGKAREVGPAADVYALGAILYETLTGRAPFKGSSVLDTLEQVRTREPVPPSQLQPRVPRDLETVCLKCLQKDPRKRYATALDLAEDLRRFLSGEPILARPAGRLERTVKWVKRRPVWAALIGVSSIAVLTLAGMSVVLLQMVLQRDGALRAEKEQARKTQLEQIEKEKSRRETQALLYAADLRGASQSWKNGEVQALRDRVDRHRDKGQGQDVPRGFEWAYFSGLARASKSRALDGHEGEVLCTAYSPDGATLATGDRSGAVYLWDTATRMLRATLKGHPEAVDWLGYLEGGKTLATRTGTELWLWDPQQATVRDKKVFKEGKRLLRPVRLALSGDARTLAFALWSPPSISSSGALTVKLWDTSSWQERSLGKVGQGNINALALSPDGGLLAIAWQLAGALAGESRSGKHQCPGPLTRRRPTGHSLAGIRGGDGGRAHGPGKEPCADRDRAAGSCLQP
jgi:hypothetical protein